MSRYAAGVEHISFFERVVATIVSQFSIWNRSLSTTLKTKIYKSNVQQLAGHVSSSTVVIAYVYTLKRTHIYIAFVYDSKPNA